MLSGIVLTLSIICAPSFGEPIGLKCDLMSGYYADGGSRKDEYVDYPGYNPHLNLRAMALEGVAAGCLSSFSWYLVWQTRPWEHYEPYSLIFWEIIAGAPLTATVGTTLIGKLFHQKGSPWKAWVGGILGGVLGSLFAGNIPVLGGPTPDYSILGLYIVTGATLGSVVGYNSIEGF